MSLKANWNFPTHIKIGLGRLKEIGQCCGDLNIFNPLVVTDKNLNDNEIIINLKNELNSSNLPHSVFSEVDSNPSEKKSAFCIDTKSFSFSLIKIELLSVD